MNKLLVLFTIVFGLNLNLQAREKTDIVDTAVGAGQFTTLVAAVQAAGLVDALKGEGPLTVFAPTDAAFAKLPEGTIPALLNDIPALTNVLTYHVVSGEPSLKRLSRQGRTATLQGQRVRVRQVGHNYYVNNSKIIGTVKVSNGQIYIIDSVLLPK